MSRKYNASGMGANPRLGNTSMLDSPSRPGGSQKATVRSGTDKAHPGEKASGVRGRNTPENQHGLGGKVEPASKQP
mgnify:CR=1 FL=1|jgi:hypothetical protein